MLTARFVNAQSHVALSVATLEAIQAEIPSSSSESVCAQVAAVELQVALSAQGELRN